MIKHFLKRSYLFIFRERGREEERKGEKHQCVVASLTQWGPGPQPRQEPRLGITQRPFGSQAGAQSTEPHQPGHDQTFSNISN